MSFHLCSKLQLEWEVKGHIKKLQICQEKEGSKYFNDRSLYIPLLSKVNKEPMKWLPKIHKESEVVSMKLNEHIWHKNQK